MVAARLQPELRPARALAAFVDAGAAAGRNADKRDIEPARDACASVLKPRAPCLAKVFAYYGQTPRTAKSKCQLPRAARRRRPHAAVTALFGMGDVLLDLQGDDARSSTPSASLSIRRRSRTRTRSAGWNWRSSSMLY